MKRFNLIGMILLAVAPMMMGGCLVWESELKKATAQNRRLIDENTELNRENMSLIDDVRRLESDLANRGSGDEQVILLQNANQELADRYAALNVKYETLWNEREGSARLPGAVNLELQRLAQQYGDVVEFSERHGMIKLRADLTFDRGSVAIRDEARRALLSLAEIVNSSAASQFNVYIAGHTDDMPITRPETKLHHPNNWYLSVHRAIEVQQSLEEAGVGSGRIAVMGFGEYHPIAPNAAGHGGNEVNRRVEIWLVPAGQLLTTGG